MRRVHIVIVASILGLVGGCASQPALVSQGDLLHENWMHSINLNTSEWVSSADSWYLTGKPNAIEKSNAAAAAAGIGATSTLVVHAPDFKKLVLSGDFQVQLVGQKEHNSVFIVGPNSALRDLIVKTTQDCLSIRAVQDSKQSFGEVIVRINIHDLQYLKTDGNGNLYGRDLMSSGLSLVSDNNGNVFLSGGRITLKSIDHEGEGNIVVLGANAQQLDLDVTGSGNVRVSGERMQINHIAHNGSGTVDLWGAETNSLSIEASGSGTTSVVGHVNVKQVKATDSSRVYLYWLNGTAANVQATKAARIGLAGTIKNLTVDLTDSARLEGRYLRSDAAYVRTNQDSHANIYANQKVFAAAAARSSVYLFGPAADVSRFTGQQGTIIPIPALSPSADTHAEEAPLFLLKKRTL